ncbi:XylR family transcriptional regulator [Pseudoduganella namucuonensis]|uniref:Transcriptional regulator, AraC family n=1 Tax=Pseudoduganella namucuonensis TaxID=1035707 RepID=A0A1I7LHD9_9BURK|nr:DNA-binding transcriptional regulator [Pseudoduganella namucuonensis]SFV09093.1 transcriptional regulator, AraC family [Pseudoduganella namucuonensis]
MKTTKPHRIALLFNGNKSFDREVISGIAGYLGSTRAAWDLFLEEDFRLRLDGIERWQGDGIIADFDDPAVAKALSRCAVPVVAVGGSYSDDGAYPRGLPYVATDNFKLIKLARDHLIDVGLQRFAMFSLPRSSENRWALERENAFRALMLDDRMDAEIFRGCETSASSWDEAVEGQIAWLRSLPKPIGIIAVTDARARQLLQACAIGGIAVPEQVALIGIDNDPMVRMLTRIPLSSVMQGAQEMGRTAAHLLDQMLHGVRLANTRIMVPPAGINVFASSKHEATRHPHVMRAHHFIRQYACQGIKTHQVAEYVGVSRSSLEACFRQELECSVHDVILRFKLDAAKARLESGESSIADVALGCGFTSIQYMHFVFKRELGCTPRVYRDRARGEAGLAA